MFILLSCFEQGDCSDYSSNEALAQFYNFSDKKARSIVIDSITTVGWDSVVNRSLSSIRLPFHSTATVMTYHFYYEKKHAVLVLSFKTETFPLAPGCDAIDLITLLEAAPTVIQDAKISQPKLTSNVVENIKLYF